MEWLRKAQGWITVLLILAGASFLCWFLYTWKYEFSSFGFGQLMAAIVLIELKIIDKFIMHGYDTLDEIGKGNLAAAVGFLSVVVLLVGCLIAAFLVFK